MSPSDAQSAPASNPETASSSAPQPSAPAAHAASPALWIDTHCHLTDEQFDADREAVLERAAEAGVGAVVVVADSLESSAAALDLAGASTFVVPASAGNSPSASFGTVEPQDRFPAEAGTTNAFPAKVDGEGVVSACGSASPAPCFASRLVATAGIHPHNAATWNAAAAAELRALCARGAVAVGEVGLDFHYDFSPRPAQVRAFAEQGALALELGLPLVMHCREAWPEFLAIVRELGLGRATGVGGRSASVPARIECPGPATGVGGRTASVPARIECPGLATGVGGRSASVPARIECPGPAKGVAGRSASVPARIAGLAPAWGVVHCFSGTPDQALELVTMGLLIGIGGTVTFKRNDEGREVARAVPLEALLLETDAPYLAPVPLRGRRNEPAMMVHSARCVAQVRGMALEDLARATRANALRLFPALAKG